MTDDLHFRVGATDEASALVMRCHYSHRVPANIQYVGTLHRAGGLFGDYGEAVAACFFSIPPTRWTEPVLELSRLVRADSVKVSLTGLIAKTCDFMRQQRAIDLVVSFADWTQRHHGGIYQAASWNYGGVRERACDGCLINGVFHPGRSLNSAYGTRSPDLLRGILRNATVEPHWDEGKHLYWRALTRRGHKQAARLDLQRLPYPKPGAVARVTGEAVA